MISKCILNDGIFPIFSPYKRHYVLIKTKNLYILFIKTKNYIITDNENNILLFIVCNFRYLFHLELFEFKLQFLCQCKHNFKNNKFKYHTYS